MADNKSLQFYIKARNDSKQAFDDASKDSRQLIKDMAKLAISGAAIGAAFKVASGLAIEAMAKQRQQAAEAEGNFELVIQNQLRINEGVSELGSAIPIIGESAKKLMLEFSNTEGLKESLGLIKQMDATLKSITQNNIKLEQSAEVRRAKLDDALQSQIEMIQWRQKELGLQEQLADLQTETQNAQARMWDAYNEAVAAADSALTESGRNAAKQVYEEHKRIYERLVFERQAMEEVLAEERKLAEAEIARQRAIEHEQASKVIMNLLASEQERAVYGIEEQFRAAKEAAETLGLGSAQVAAIEKEKNERIAAVRRQAAEREKAEQARLRDEERREADALAKDRADLEKIKFDATHDAREREMRDLREHFGEMRQAYKENEEMLTLIREAEAARRAEIEKKYAKETAAVEQAAERPSPADRRDRGFTSALSSRFLTTAPQLQNPELDQLKTQTELLKEIARKNGITVKQWSIN